MVMGVRWRLSSNVGTGGAGAELGKAVPIEGGKGRAPVSAGICVPTNGARDVGLILARFWAVGCVS